MYAIIEIGGKQFKVEKEMSIDVDKVSTTSQDKMVIDKVLMCVDGSNVMIGKPYLNNVKITAAVLGIAKGKKVRGVKFEKRKNHTKRMGFRQDLLQLKIQELVVQ
jgi:large subunit ribosomal protein L21